MKGKGNDQVGVAADWTRHQPVQLYTSEAEGSLISDWEVTGLLADGRAGGTSSRNKRRLILKSQRFFLRERSKFPVPNGR